MQKQMNKIDMTTMMEAFIILFITVISFGCLPSAIFAKSINSRTNNPYNGYKNTNIVNSEL